MEKVKAEQWGKSGLRLTVVAALALSVLAGCGGGGSSSSGGTVSNNSGSGNPSNTPASATNNSTPASLSGTVAVGGAIAGADVTVIDAAGNSITTISDASGNYTVSLTGLTAPLLIVASDPTGVHPALASVVARIPTDNTAPVIGNVTTLTTAVAAFLTASGNTLDLTASGNLTALAQPASVSAAIAKLNSALANILPANGLNVASFDPVGATFTANQSGADAVIDAVQIVPAPAGGFQLISSAAPATSITLNQSASVSTALIAPPVTANYLQPLVSALAQCLANNTSCGQAIDANYKDNGYTSFTSAHTQISAAGVTLGVPQTLRFFTGNGGTQQATVAFPYTTPGGVAGTVITVVQQTGNGSWDIIGNQQAYNATIVSYLEKRQFLSPADIPYNRYEAGLEIDVPVGGVNPSNLASASVTGPGINGTLYLVPHAGTGSDTFALTSAAQTSAPTGGATSDSNTNLYRWSWQALPEATKTYAPPTSYLGFYAATSINLANVPQFATYTVTFYDSTGKQIGDPMSVVNATPPMGASAGAGVAWQTLLQTVETNFLNPGGALASQDNSVGLSWSNLVNNQNIAPLASRAQIQTVPGTGVTTGQVNGWWNGPATFNVTGQYSTSVTAGVAQNGVQQCSPACPFPALQSGGYRLVQLSWSVGAVSYYNIWKYND